jgi:hypothetical protein
MQKRIKFTCQSTKQLKLESYLLNLPRMHGSILSGALVSVWLQRPVGQRACSLLSIAQSNHVGVQQSAKGPQLHVDAGAVSLTAPVDVLPLMLTNWMDHCPILPSPNRWSQQRASQPGQIELVTSYKNEYK